MEEIWSDYDLMLSETSDTCCATTALVREYGSSQYNCIECGHIKVFNSDNIPVCTSCGLMEPAYVNDSPEWISGVSEDGVVSDQARCGMPTDTTLFSEKWGYGSIISKKGSSSAMKRLSMINFHGSMNHKDRSLFHAYKDIDEAAKDILNLPESVLTNAKILYRKFNTAKLTRGAIRTGIKANCVLYACRLSKVPRTTKEVADAFGIETRDISRTTELFKNYILGIGETASATTPGITRPTDVIHRLLNEFDLDNKRAYRMKCLKLSEKIEQCPQLMGKTPTSIASFIILKVLGNLTSKSDICKKCSISLPTLNKIEVIATKYLEGLV
jgi:transcription initiation factor TFIIIB Brf1 subunit/transcription initiation factor TFIIB